MINVLINYLNSDFSKETAFQAHLLTSSWRSWGSSLTILVRSHSESTSLIPSTDSTVSHLEQRRFPFTQDAARWHSARQADRWSLRNPCGSKERIYWVAFFRLTRVAALTSYRYTVTVRSHLKPTHIWFNNGHFHFCNFTTFQMRQIKTRVLSHTTQTNTPFSEGGVLFFHSTDNILRIPLSPRCGDSLSYTAGLPKLPHKHLSGMSWGFVCLTSPWRNKEREGNNAKIVAVAVYVPHRINLHVQQCIFPGFMCLCT